MNMNNLMAQAKKMQKDIENKQKEINSMDFIGESEWVKVTLKGDKKVSKIEFKKNDNMDSEDIECLEDMIKIAFEDAYKKIDLEFEQKMGMYGKLAGGLF